MKVRRLRKTPAHLEITAFINLIVVLVPFLLSTAVFTRLAVIDLALPAQSSDAIAKLDPDKPLKLEIVIRHDGLQVQDRHGGSLTPIGDRIPNVASGPDTKALAVLVQAIKTKFPQHDDATVLAETNTSYETLVQGDGRGARRPPGAGRQGGPRRLLPQHLDRRRADRPDRGGGDGAGGPGRAEEAMKLTPRQRRAEHKGRNKTMVDMNLVSLIDVFTILIFFLLSNSGGVETLPSPKAVHLPESVADKAPRETVIVVVSGTEILVGGRRIASVAEVMATEGDLIEPLKAELEQQAGREVIRKENEADAKRADDHGRQGHPVPPAAQDHVHRRPRQLRRRVVRGAAEARAHDGRIAGRA